MAYRILADENTERATGNYLWKLGHDLLKNAALSGSYWMGYFQEKLK